MGAKLGFQAFPKHLEKYLFEEAWIDRLIDPLLKIMGSHL